MNNRRTLLILAIALVVAAALGLGSSIYALRRARAGQAGDAAGDAKVIRFARNPEPAPPFLLHDISGKIVSSADFKGKVVILNFWATW